MWMEPLNDNQTELSPEPQLCQAFLICSANPLGFLESILKNSEYFLKHNSKWMFCSCWQWFKMCTLFSWGLLKSEVSSHRFNIFYYESVKLNIHIAKSIAPKKPFSWETLPTNSHDLCGWKVSTDRYFFKGTLNLSSMESKVWFLAETWKCLKAFLFSLHKPDNTFYSRLQECCDLQLPVATMIRFLGAHWCW